MMLLAPRQVIVALAPLPGIDNAIMLPITHSIARTRGRGELQWINNLDSNHVIMLS